MALGAIGAGVATLFGGTIAATSITAGIIGGAVVGAAIGGLTAAISGGSILEGVLFGAIGGAVTGGVSAWASGGIAAGVGPVAPGAGQTAIQTGMSVTETAAVAAGSTTEVVATTSAMTGTGGSTIGGALTEIGKGFAKEYGGDFVKGVAGMYVDQWKADETMKKEMQMAQLAHQQKMELMEKQASLAKSSSSGGGGGQDVPYMDIEKIRQETEFAKLGEQRRQYDAGAAERAQAREDLQEKEAERQALFKNYGQRGQAAGEGTGGAGVYEERQQSALAGTEGGQTLTKPVEEEQQAALQ